SHFSQYCSQHRFLPSLRQGRVIKPATSTANRVIATSAAGTCPSMVRLRYARRTILRITGHARAFPRTIILRTIARTTAAVATIAASTKTTARARAFLPTIIHRTIARTAVTGTTTCSWTSRDIRKLLTFTATAAGWDTTPDETIVTTIWIIPGNT